MVPNSNATRCVCVRPEPSLAMGAMSASGDDTAQGWVVPLVVCFILTLGVLATLALFFVKYRAGANPDSATPFWKAGNLAASGAGGGHSSDRFYTSFATAVTSSVNLKHRRKKQHHEGMRSIT